MLKERTSLVEVDPLLLRRTRGIFSATATLGPSASRLAGDLAGVRGSRSDVEQAN